jgi:hypothetical protein
MRRPVLFVLVLSLVVVPLIAQGHILKLKDGRILKGQFISGMTDMIRFHVEGDTIRNFLIDEVLAIHFSSATIDAPPPQASEPVKIFPGTVVRIKLTSELGTKSSSAGDRFFAEIAEDFIVDDVTLSAQGKRVFGRVRKVVKPKRSGDRSVIEILVTDLTVAGKTLPVITDFFGIEHDGKGNYNLLGTARSPGAGLPTFIDDRNLRLPAGTVFDFRITQPVTIRNVSK